MNGANFNRKTLFRPTALSLAMASVGLIPGTHLVTEGAASLGLMRSPRDRHNTAPSVQIAL